MLWLRRSYIKMLADRGHTLNPVCLLHQVIKSARATDDQMALTVGEANSKARTPRAAMWLVAVFFPSIFMAVSTFLAYVLYTHPFFSSGYPWCLPAIMLWGVYMALVSVVMVYMDLFLPDAPVALREALADVGWGWVGVPVVVIDHYLIYFGQAWMIVAMVCLLGILIASILALWVCLIRTYRNY